MQKTAITSMLILIALAVSAPFLHASTTLTYTYDANGNLIGGDGKHYEYNDANKLVKVRHGDASGPVIVEYVYDYTGQRIKKIENGSATYYIGKHYEQQTDGVTSSTTNYYFANGERVAKKDQAGNMYYYHSDHLGGTNVVTDSVGNLVERVKYYPFGEIREGGNEKYLYTGKEKDHLTDWYYYEARYYNSDFKHFTQADTIDPDYYDPQDLNRYAYVRNNPLTLIDPDGNSWTGFGKEIGLTAFSATSSLFHAGMASVSWVTGHKAGAASNLVSALNDFNNAAKHAQATGANLGVNLIGRRDITYTAAQMEGFKVFNTKLWKGITGMNTLYGYAKLLDVKSYENLKNLRQIKNINKGKFALASFGKGLQSLNSLISALEKGSLGSAVKERYRLEIKKHKN